MKIFGKTLVAGFLSALLGIGPAFADKITVGMQLEPPILDPTAAAPAAIDEIVYANLFEGLTRYNEDGSISPALAKSWEISDDGTVYTFLLNEGVTFHDGTALTAADVKFSLDRARAEDSLNAQKQLFAGIAEVTVVDDLMVRITLSAANSGFTRNLAWGDAVILSEASAETAATAPVGTGPMKFSRWVKGDRVELEKFDAYWGSPIALSGATFKFISDPTAAFAAMMAGDIDAFPGFPATETLAQFEADPRFKVIVGNTEGETILAMNNKSEALSDIRVRKAVTFAMDRAAIIEGAMFGYGTPIGTHFPPHNPNYKDLLSYSPYDPAAAKALLEEAGYGQGDLSLTLKLPPPAYARRSGEIIAAQLNEIGVKAEISKLEWSLWLEQVFRGKDFDLTIVSHTEPDDINIYGRPEYYFQYDNPKINELLDALVLTVDPTEQSAILSEAQEVIAADYVNGYLFQLPRTSVANSKISGLWKNSPTQANDLTGVSWN